MRRVIRFFEISSYILTSVSVILLCSMEVGKEASLEFAAIAYLSLIACLFLGLFARAIADHPDRYFSLVYAFWYTATSGRVVSSIYNNQMSNLANIYNEGLDVYFDYYAIR